MRGADNLKGGSEIVDEIVGALKPEFGEDGARKIVDLLIRHFSGQQIYLPSYKKFKKGDRDAAIRAEFDGTNYRELARKYDLTVDCVRCLIRKK